MLNNQLSNAQWEEVTLGQFLQPNLRKVEKPKEAYLRLGVRSHGKGIFTTIVEDPESVAMSHLYQVREGDLIVSITFAWEGAIAIVNGDGDEALVSHRFPTYEFFGEMVHPDYFKYLMHTRKFFYDLGLISPGGAGRNRVLRKGDFLKIKITAPPLPVQKKIAQILETSDETVRLIIELITAKQEQKKGLMQHLLSGKLRFQENVYSNTKQKTKFGEIPTDWQIVALNKLVRPISRSVSVNPNKEYKFIGVRWHGAGAHIHDIAKGSTIKTRTLSRIEEGDILYNKMWTSKAAFAIARKQHNGSYGTSEYPQFEADPKRLDVDYLEYVFHHPRFQYDAISLCRGTTERARLNPRDFLNLEVPLPDLEEQRNIANVLQTCDQEITLLQEELAGRLEQKKGLVQKLLTGKIGVKV